MHRCLAIPEILEHILAHLEDKISKADLVSAALTCQLFASVASKFIWKRLPNLSPILLCFPRDAVRLNRQIEEKGCGKEKITDKFTLARKLLPQDWNRMLRYLNMICYIEDDSYHKTRISNALYSSLHTSLPRKLLAFPNLRTLSLPQECSEVALAFYLSFLNPQMVALDIKVRHYCAQSFVDLFMFGIPAFSPNLTKLKISAQSLDVEAISHAVRGCQHLKELRVPCLNEAALIHISQLPWLHTLNLDDQDVPGINTYPDTPGSAFPILQSLELCNTLPSFDISLFAIITSDGYGEYHGKFRRAATKREWKELFTRLATVSSGYLEIHFDDQKQPTNSVLNNPDYHISPDVIRPLLSLKNLFDLSLSSVSSFTLDDPFILEMAIACPELCSVDFGSEYRSDLHPRTTLVSYIHLLRHCRCLGTIGLAVDASVVPGRSELDTQDVESLGSYKRNLTLYVGDSPIEDPTAVASFLSLFMDLSTHDEPPITAAYDCPRYIERKWNAVKHALQHMQTGNFHGSETRI